MTARDATIEQHRAAIRALRDEIAAAQGRLRALGGAAARAQSSLQILTDGRLAENLAAIEAYQLAAGGYNALNWDDPRWTDWTPQPDAHPERLRWGHAKESRSGALLPTPATLPFIGAGNAIVITSRGPAQAAAAESLLQSLVVRTAVTFPQQCRYTLLDPAGNGMAFPMARYLPRVSPGTGDVRRDLDAVIHEIQRIISTYIDAGTRSFEDIPEEMRLNEAFHFVFAADFPNRYDLRAAEALQSVAATGRPAGVYLILHHNLDHDPGTDLSRYEIGDRQVIDMAGAGMSVHGLDATVVPDTAPPADLQDLLFARIKAAPPLDRPISWDEVAGRTKEEWWSWNADTILEAPFGRHGANQNLNVWFGENERERRPCAHGVIGAMTGAGKSTLFHALITSLAIRYSPEELRFYLIDGKFGVEFQPYRTLPHAEVVSLRTSPELARSVIADLADEMGRRNAVFSRHNVKDLPEYRALGQPDGAIPRLLLLVDEYQQLFDGDKDGEASALLLRLSQQGRSAGIHMLLASQRFDTPGMLHRTDTFGNIHLRLAMQISQADIAALTDFGQKGRRLISATCDRPGRIVVNDRAGDDDSNVAGKVALLTSGRRDAIIRELGDLVAERDLPPTALPRRVVFNGEAQPELLDNPGITLLGGDDRWLPPADLEKLARTSRDDGGFGIEDWLAPERPVAMSLGQEFNVRGHAAVVLRRRPNQNLLQVGDRHHERVAMTASSLVSAALCEAPGQVRFAVNDRSVLRTEWADVLEQAVDVLTRIGYDATYTRDEESGQRLIGEIAEEIDRRRELPEDDRIDEPTYLVYLNEPDRITALHRVPDEFAMSDSETGHILKRVLTQGPSVGVHVIAGFASLGVAKSVLSEKSIQNEFVHRIALQMSEDDSFVLVRSSLASKLQLDGERPVAALLFDNQRQLSVRFKPYSVRANEGGEAVYGSLTDQIVRVGHRLEGRSQ